MKSIISCLLVFLTIITLHSGRTDSQGGHWDHSTGEYHFHHGYPAHQHPNGICPYSSEAKSVSRNSSDQSSTVKIKSRSSGVGNILLIIALLLISNPLGWGILFFAGSGIHKLFVKLKNVVTRNKR